MKITELASLILELSKNPHNRNLKYIKGLINEQLHLRSYNKLLKEIDEEEDELPNPEEDEKPEIILAEPEDKGIEKGLDPLLNPGEEPEFEKEPESQEEPAATVDDIPVDEPKMVPTPRKGPAAKVEPTGEPKIKTISVQEARELLSYKGKIGKAIFTKKDGTRRAMNFMTGVRKYTSGGQLPYSPKDKGVIPVYDLKIGNGPKGYRMINVDGLESLQMDGQQYKIDHSLKEIKVYRPNTGDNINEIIDLIRTKDYNLTKGLIVLYGYKDGEKFSDFYKELDSKERIKLIELLKKLPNRELKEIKVKSPFIDPKLVWDIFQKRKYEGDIADKYFDGLLTKYRENMDDRHLIHRLSQQELKKFYDLMKQNPTEAGEWNGINEIKVNNPNFPTEFPITINSIEDWKRIKPYLNKKGYKFNTQDDRSLFHSGFPSAIYQFNPFQLHYTNSLNQALERIDKYPGLKKI